MGERRIIKLKIMLKEIEEKLLKEKESIEKELNKFAKEDATPDNWNTKFPKYDGDLESEADEVQEYEKLLSVEYSLEKKLTDVNLALEKIKNNSFGKCEKCGKEINPERIEACPEARLCSKCN